VLIVGVATLFAGAGLLLGPILYYSLRQSLPAFAKAAGLTSLVLAALVLGALVLCFGAFWASGGGHH